MLWRRVEIAKLKTVQERIPVTHRDSGDRLEVAAKIDEKGDLYLGVHAELAEFLIGRRGDEAESA